PDVRLVEEVRERRPSPEREPLAERVEGGLELAARAGPLGLAEPELEEAEIDVLGLGGDEIAGPDGLQPLPAEQLAELGHVGLEQLRGAPRRPVVPELAEQRLRRHDLAAAEQQRDEQRGGLPTGPDAPAFADDLERAED